MESLFSVGQKIVCVNSREVEGWLTEGKTYEVTACVKCPHCGEVGVTLGHPADGARVVCGKTGHRYQFENNELGFKQGRFIPLDFDRQADEIIHQALKEDLKIKNFQDN